MPAYKEGRYQQEQIANALDLRQYGAMMPLMTPASSDSTRTLDWINLRFPPEFFKEIDALRSRRGGYGSRDTWITEVIQEKLLRVAANNLQQASGE